MKKLTYLLIVLVAFAGCKKDKTTEVTQHDIMLRGKATLKSTRADAAHLTPQQIAKYATNITYRVKVNDWRVGRAGFSMEQRDTVNGVLKRWATDILKLDKTLDLDFVTGKDMVLERGVPQEPPCDTIGYIPNAVLQEAYSLIIDAHAKQDWQAVYDIFNTKFVFIPITGAEYRELVRQGKN